jgi:hypothetical protein
MNAILVVVVMVCGYITIRAFEALGVMEYRRRRVRLLMADRNGGVLRDVWAKARGNEVTLKEKGREPRTLVLHRDACFPRSVRPTWIVDEKSGWNVRVSTADDLVTAAVGDEKEALLDMLPYNAESYFYAIERNDARDALESNQAGGEMIAKLAPWAFVALLAILGTLIYMASAMARSGGG